MSVAFVINPGAASKKYALFTAGKVLLSATYEQAGHEYVASIKKPDSKESQRVINTAIYQNSIADFKQHVDEVLQGQEVSVIGVRTVASGTHFQTHQIVDDVLLSLLREKESTAPLHIPVTLTEIQTARALFPGVPVVAVSDTEAFKELPAIERSYSLSPKDSEDYDLYKFGYHGLSVKSVVARAHAVLGNDPARLIVCHLGSGMSVTGINNGKIVSTSAGYSSVSGLPMITRGGDVDSGMLLELLRLEHGNLERVRKRLHHEGGVAALAGTTDVRMVLAHSTQGSEVSTFALKFVANQIQKAVAAATVSTEGVDALIFTGTIGQRSPEFRKLIVDGLGHFGIAIDQSKNDIFLNREGVVSPMRSLQKTAVVCTDEMGEIARAALRTHERE